MELTAEQIREEIRKTKAELLRLQHEKETLRLNRRLWFFRPSPKQLTFFEQALRKRRAGFCGNRFGKSTLGVVEDCCWLIGYRPFFPEGHPLRTLGIPRHGVKGLVIAEDNDKVKEIFTNNESADRPGKFIEFLPNDWCVFKKNEKGVIVQINVKSEIDGVVRESVVYFDTVQSYKKNPASAESSDWDFIHVDEPIIKGFWTAVSRGLIDRGGSSWWLLTPIKEPWMYNEIKANAQEDPDGPYWFFEASMDDNPTLAQEDKEMYLRELPEDEREARRLGKPLAHARLVFGHFSKDYHLFDGTLPGWTGAKPPAGKHQVVFAIDIHPQTPHAVLFVSINEKLEIDIYDELFVKATISELSQMVLTRLAGLRVAYGLCEPAAWNRDQGSGICHADTFYACGLDLIPGSKRKEDAIILTQELFKQRKRVVRIHKRCTQLIKELEQHYFDKDDKPADKDDHLIECLRRIVIHDDLTYYPEFLPTAHKQAVLGDNNFSLSLNRNISEFSLTNI